MNIQELSMDDIKLLGVDISMIKVCQKIRGLAKLDRITLDESTHRSGINKQLFDYIEYCGIDILSFIKDYLSNLQPYMLERRKEQEKKDTFICVIDNLYKISIYIKIDTKQFEEIIVSFHEDNKRGIAKSNNVINITKQSKFVAVFADLMGRNSIDGTCVVKVIVQRGLKVLPLDLAAKKFGAVFIVRRSAIDEQFISYCNDYIRELYTSNLDLDFDDIEVFSMLQQISFTSYGKDTFSSISLLIDSIVKQKDQFSKAAADFALVTFVQNLYLTAEQQDELRSLLRQKYVVSDIKHIDLILNRVESNLSLHYNLDLQLDDSVIEAAIVYEKLQEK